MFEAGADTGDTPGEYQYWVEREHLDTVLPFPQGYHDLRINPHTGVLGLLTGVGTARAAATVMALGLDPRFDLTHAYFLVAGIGGIDPPPARWLRRLERLDRRRRPGLRDRRPRDPAKSGPPATSLCARPSPTSSPAPHAGDDSNVYQLNPALVDWAFSLTKDMATPRHPEMKSAVCSTTGPRSPPSLRFEGRQPLRQHILARQADEPVGAGLGEVYDRGQGTYAIAAWRTPAHCSR